MIHEFIQLLYKPNCQIPNNEEICKKILDDIEFFNISPQIYYLLKQIGMLERTPSPFQKTLAQNYNTSLFQNIYIKNQTELVLNKFEEFGIEVIPLKGVVFTEKYFGHIGARCTSDIDILVKPESLSKAIQCVKQLGFTLEHKQIPNHFHQSFSKRIMNSPQPLTVEIHWDILKEKTSNFDVKEFWIHSHPYKNHTYVKELSDFHTFYLILLHGWRHNLDSLKYFIDIMHLIHKLQRTLDLNQLFNTAKSHQTYNRIVRTLSIVYKNFPHLNKILELPIERKYLFWDYEHFRNKENKSIKKYIDFIDFQLFSYDQTKHCYFELVTALKTNKRI